MYLFYFRDNKKEIDSLWEENGTLYTREYLAAKPGRFEFVFTPSSDAK